MAYTKRVRLGKQKLNDKGDLQRGLVFPMPLAKALTKAGYTHLDMEVLREGILLKPVIVPADQQGVEPEVVDLPNW